MRVLKKTKELPLKELMLETGEVKPITVTCYKKEFTVWMDINKATEVPQVVFKSGSEPERLICELLRLKNKNKLT